MDITIYTANLTSDTLDPHGWIRPEYWQDELDRYIEMAVAAVQRLYPAAVVETAMGNGLATCDAYGGPDDPQQDYDLRADVEDELSRVYQTWTETIDDAHCYTQTDHPEPAWLSGASD